MGWSTNPSIYISEVAMSALPNINKLASQTQIKNLQVCHTCQHLTVCINCDNAYQECNRCGCTVGTVISVLGCSLSAYDVHHIQILNVVPLDSYLIFYLWSAVSSAPGRTLQWGTIYFHIISWPSRFSEEIFFCHKMCFDFLYKNYLKHFYYEKRAKIIQKYP
jgi:hypothetical protein